MKDIKKNKWLIISIILLTVSLLTLVVYPVMSNPMNNVLDTNQVGPINTDMADIPKTPPNPRYNARLLTELTEDMIDQEQLGLNEVIAFTPSTVAFTAQEFINDRDPLVGVSFAVGQYNNPSPPLSICIIKDDEWIGLAEINSNDFPSQGEIYFFTIDLSSNPISLSNKEGELAIGVFGNTDSDGYYVVGGKVGNPYPRGVCHIMSGDWYEAPAGFDTTFVTFTTSSGGDDDGGGDDGGDDGGSQTPVINTSISLYITSAVGYISLIGAVASIIKYGMIVGWI